MSAAPVVELEGGLHLESLLPTHDDVLSPEECGRLAVAITAQEPWNHVELIATETRTRSYALLHGDEQLEIWLLGWQQGHSTGFHDHGISNVGFCIVRGRLIEKQLRLAKPPQRRVLDVGVTRTADHDYIHCLELSGRTPALSLHVYSPPLGVIGQYRVDDAGVLRRSIQSGQNELTSD